MSGSALRRAEGPWALGAWAPSLVCGAVSHGEAILMFGACVVCIVRRQPRVGVKRPYPRVA